MKSTCQICNRFVGPLNEVVEEDVIPNDICTEPVIVGSFKIERMNNFLPGMNPANVHPSLPYEIKSQDLVLYFPSIGDDKESRKTIIVSNPKLGEQFRIVIPQSRKSTNVGMVDDTE